MSILKTISRVIKKIQNEGAIKTLIDSISYLYDHYYDVKYGIDTYSWVSKQDLTAEDAIAAHASCYQATKVLALRKLFKKLNIASGKILIDIGSGKGRILLVASEFGFKKVRGVELSSNLCSIAQKNITTYQNGVNTNTLFEVINIDATQYNFEDDEYVLFMFNPFDEFILKKVLTNLSLSIKRKKRPVLIVYAYPVKNNIIKEAMDIEKITNYKFWNQTFAIYELSA
tara:strand:+ start:15760 stop:16443 length:684 start_codon:yes stop_codon:yes gene_type:complete